MMGKEQNLELTGEKCNDIFDALPCPMYVWRKKDNDLILIKYNDAAKIFTEGKVESLLGIKASELHRNDPIILRDLNQSINEKITISKEFNFNLKSLNKKADLKVDYIFIPPDLVLVHTHDITKQKKLQDTLLKSEKEKSIILNSTRENITFQDKNLKIIWANKAAADSTNMTLEELLGKYCYEIWPKRNEPCENCPVLKSITTGLPEKSEQKTPDGKYWSISANPVKDENGNVLGTVEITIETTAQKFAEENLRRERDILGRITDTSPVGITLVNKIGEIRFANPQAEKILGLSKDEITQRTYNAPSWKITDNDGNPFPDEELPFQKVKNTRESVFDVRHAIKWPSGLKRYLSINASPIFDESGNFDGMVATLEDITEKWMIEQKLRESDEKFRTLAENIPGVIYLCKNDERWTMLYLNNAVKQLTGYPKEDFISDQISFVDIYHPDDTPQIFEVVEKALEKHVPFHLTYRIKHKSGDWRWIDEVGIGIYENDEIVMLEGFLTDITDIKLAEQKLKKSEEKYRKAYNRLDLYKDLFTHDINNIFQNILSSNELIMLYSNNPEKLQDFVEVANLIKEQVSRGASLVSNVQLLTELEEKEKPIISIEICSLLKNAINQIKKENISKEINVNVESAQNQYYVMANELLFEVFENILSNSIKHNKNPQIKVLIKISNIQDNNQKFLKLEFIDNGIGIPDSMKENIFKREFQRDESSGIGLGLLLIKRILDSYKGKIEVKDRIEGDYSKGSNFTILIPEVN
ncbi:MAG: PAS domain S-box protein [Candidatus Hermodarchaeota archaeon]